mgnify:CR=1 FL=1
MYFKNDRTCGYNEVARKKADLRKGLISWWLAEREIVNGKGDVNNNVSNMAIHGVRPVIFLKK